MVVIKKINKLLKTNEKKSLIKILLLTLIVSILELLGIGLILPIIYSLIDENIFLQNKILVQLFELINLNTNKEKFIFIILSFIFVIFIKSLLQTLFTYLQIFFFSNVSIRLNHQFFSDYIYSPWSFIMKKNTATLMRNFQVGIGDYCNKLLPSFISLISEIILSTTFCFFLFFLYPIQFLIIILVIVPLGFFIQKFTKKYNYKFGAIRQKYSSLINKQIIQSFRIPKLLKIMSKEFKVIQIYQKFIATELNAKNKQLLIERLPRVWIEFFFIILIIFLLSFLLILNGNITEQINFIIIFTLVGLRLLPSLNKILIYIQSLRYTFPALNLLYNEYDDLNKIKSEKNNNIKDFQIKKFEISLKNIDFKYDDTSDYLFKNLNLTIPENSSIAIIGKSGVGKSTLADLIMGILNPKKGKLIVDDIEISNDIIKKKWQSVIGYVPQETYILDDSLKNNIVLGENNEIIDYEKIKHILKILELDNIVDRSKLGLDMILGESGIKISSGQKQRIGIARALYINPKILILDEATSALDSQTENKIISILKKLKNKMTIIFITHRKAGEFLCEKILNLDKL